MIATPEGKLSRYFYGIDYAPKDVKFGLTESSAKKIGNPAEQLFCIATIMIPRPVSMASRS